MASERYVLIKDRPPINPDLLAREFLVGDHLTDEMRRRFLAVLPDLRIYTPQGEEQNKFLGSVWAHITNAAAMQYLLTHDLIRQDPIRGSIDVKRFADYFLSSCGTFFLPQE